MIRIKNKLITLFCVYSTLSFGQLTYPFPQPGLEQTQVYIGDWTTGNHVYNESFKYTNDTTVGSYTYAKLVYVAHSADCFYTFYDSAKVYYFQQGESLINPYSGILLYDFNLVAGDSIQLYNTGTFYYHVDSVGTIPLPNGQSRKYISFIEGVNWIDGVGDIDRGFTYSIGGICGGHEEFVCQKDTSGLVYTKPETTFECDINEPVLVSDTIFCDPFTFVLDVVGETCYSSCNGSITVTIISGGTPSYTYSIDGLTFQSSGYFSGLCSFFDGYNVVIQDASGNQCSIDVYVPVESSLAINMDSVSNVSCYGGFDGLICVEAYGEEGLLQYSIAGMTNFTGCFNMLTSMFYEVCITNSMGCMVCDTITILQPDLLTCTHTSTPATCDTCCDGNVTINPSGGTPPYEITYIDSITPLTNNFCIGEYIYCVTDNNGCQFCDTAIVSFTTSIKELALSNFLIYPNPAHEKIIIETNSSNKVLSIVDLTGRVVYNQLITQSKTEINVTGLSNGLYNVTYGGKIKKLLVNNE